MLKTKFKVEINGRGNHSEFLLKVIGNHNSGQSFIDLDIMAGYMLAKKAEYPTLVDGRVAIKNDGDTIHVSDDNGETYYLSITECTYEILEVAEQD